MNNSHFLPEYSSLAEQSGIPEHVLQFMNSLPVTGEIVEWIEQFREALRLFLGDVDRIAVNININCNLADSEKGGVALAINHHASLETTVAILQKGTEPSQLMLQELRRLGHSLQEYHYPFMYDYYAANSYLGSILLFRNKDTPAISQRTDSIMESLRPFFIFILSDLITRYHYTYPAKATFLGNLLKCVGELGLTGRDAESVKVLVLRLYGFSYMEISSQLNVSVDMAKRHASRIARTGSAQTLMEIFSRRFMPWLEEPGDEFWDDVRAAIQERQVTEISRRKVKRMERRNIRRRKKR